MISYPTFPCRSTNRELNSPAQSNESVLCESAAGSVCRCLIGNSTFPNSSWYTCQHHKHIVMVHLPTSQAYCHGTPANITNILSWYTCQHQKHSHGTPASITSILPWNTCQHHKHTAMEHLPASQAYCHGTPANITNTLSSKPTGFICNCKLNKKKGACGITQTVQCSAVCEISYVIKIQS